MALVMLPCDLPWWSNVHRKLTTLQECTEFNDMLDIMLKIHDLCNVSLDPDEDKQDSTIFDGLRKYVTDLDVDEQEHFQNFTIKNIAKRAQSLKTYRPSRGLEFSLQQQTDVLEINYNLVAALLGNAFFSTFPKRTEKTHPTLQDFNFTNFFRGLDSNSQKSKLRSFLYYFEWIERNDRNLDGYLKISRKVMTGKQWLTIEDWLECGLPLCPLEIRHEGKIELSRPEVIQTVFASSRLGDNVLNNGTSQESMIFSTFPELLAILLYVEALEDNETILVEHIRQLSRIVDLKQKAIYEAFDQPKTVSLCLMDAESYNEYPLEQFEEDNILRELNKCLLSFRKTETKCTLLENRELRKSRDQNSSQRRLSPIGESGTSSPNDIGTTIVIRQASTMTKKSSYDSGRPENDIAQRRTYLVPHSTSATVVSGPTASGRKGRFIVLGSSGECLPVSRRSVSQANSSLYSSCDSLNEMDNDDEDVYISAKTSFDEDSDDDDRLVQRYINELDTPAKRHSFADKLKEALNKSDYHSEGTDFSSYAVDISVSGSKAGDGDGIRIKRGGSRGFALRDDSLNDEFLRDERMLINNNNNNHVNNNNKWDKNCLTVQKNERNTSSNYSFSTDYSSELEELYDNFSKWLDDPILKGKSADPRDEAVLNFANSLLKRTLSESFVGIPLTDGCISNTPAEENLIHDYQSKKHKKPIMNSRSLSLELAKHKHRLAAQLMTDSYTTQSNQTNTIKCQWSLTQISSQQTLKSDSVTLEIQHLGNHRMFGDNKSGQQPIATGNWGCGSRLKGNVQLKLVIQWMAASVAGVPVLIYYTNGDTKLSKLDTLCRVLIDRKWTVGELASATMLHSKDILEDVDDFRRQNECFFEKLIGI